MLDLSTKSSDDEEVLCSCSTDLARAANLWIGGRLISLVERPHGILWMHRGPLNPSHPASRCDGADAIKWGIQGR